MKTRKTDTRRLALMALFVALTLLLNLTPIGLIPLPVIKGTTLHIPVIVGAILLGPAAGGILGGLFGLVLGCVSLLYHLAGLESFGVAYLAPFTAGPGTSRGRPNLIRPPLPTLKWRDGPEHTRNRRNQR